MTVPHSPTQPLVAIVLEYLKMVQSNLGWGFSNVGCQPPMPTLYVVALCHFQIKHIVKWCLIVPAHQSFSLPGNIIKNHCTRNCRPQGGTQIWFGWGVPLELRNPYPLLLRVILAEKRYPYL